MQFTVTRHTPRHRPPRRILTPPEDPLPSTGKRLKLDPQTTATPGKYRNCHCSLILRPLPYLYLKSNTEGGKGLGTNCNPENGASSGPSWCCPRLWLVMPFLDTQWIPLYHKAVSNQHDTQCMTILIVNMHSTRSLCMTTAKETHCQFEPLDSKLLHGKFSL